ncbi:2-hydroxyacid dehydrogenase [Chloroflexota bacterium]
MAKGKVVFLTRIASEMQDTFISEAPPNLQVVLLHPNAGEEEITRQVRDADFLVTLYSGRIPDQVLQQAKQLKLIQSMGQGTDHIPGRLASELGIPIANSGGANVVAVAEHTVLLMLATMRNFLPSVETIRQGKSSNDMERRDFHQLYEKTVGIVGFGNIGRWVAKVVQGFDTNVIFYEKADIPQPIIAELQARRVSLDELLSSADIVTLHVPLLESTRRMIGWEQLTMMKPSAFLINTSRGSVVDEAALIRALREKRIAGAGIDVFEQEPPSLDNPLLNMDNVVATPHIGGAAWENWLPRVGTIWENILRVWEGGEPHNIVTLEDA